MGIGAWLWATHPRRIVVLLCGVLAVFTLMSLATRTPLLANLSNQLHWIPMAALTTSRTAREAAATFWISGVVVGAAVGLALLGDGLAWFSAAAAAVVAAVSYYAHGTRGKIEASSGVIAPSPVGYV